MDIFSQCTPDSGPGKIEAPTLNPVGCCFCRDLAGGRLPKDGYLLADLELRTLIEAYAEDGAIFAAVRSDRVCLGLCFLCSPGTSGDAFRGLETSARFYQCSAQRALLPQWGNMRCTRGAQSMLLARSLCL
jgi:hypothetical protein